MHLLTTRLRYIYSRPIILFVAFFFVGSLTGQGLFGQSAEESQSIPALDPHTEPEPKKQWVRATSLIEQLESVAEIPQATSWARETISILESLAQTPIGANRELHIKLLQLQDQSELIPQIQAQIWNQQQFNPNDGLMAHQHATEVERIGYRIVRRLSVWWPASQLKTTINFTDPWSSPASFRRISFGELDPRWSEYLKLSDFRKTFRSINPDQDKQKKVSREVLARLYSPVLKPMQKQYLQSTIDPSVVEFLRGHASNSIDVESLLKRIERYETRSASVSGFYLNDSLQDLAWSSDPAQNQIAQHLNAHYRNANVRFSVSGRLLNRLIPQLPATAEPVSETVQGAKVSGNSQIYNNIRIALEPNPSQLSLRLESSGHIDADTVARTNTFQVSNQGRAHFHVFQNLKIGPEGINALEAPYSTSSANQNVVGLESTLDNVPFVGWMARKLATNKLREDGPKTARLFKEKVRVSAESRMRQEAQNSVDKLRQYTYQNFFEPLVRMELEPQAVQMSTSADQLMMRYRIAGPDQMAANSARPRDSGQSLISLQLHQTAINNAIDRVGLKGNTFNIDELSTHLSDVIGLPLSMGADKSKSSDKKYAEIGFASLAPIEIEFVEDRFRITLNLKTLKIGKKGKQWKNLSLVAAYEPIASGTQFVLVQDDQGTRIKGKKRIKFTDKAAISTVMKVMFKKQYIVNALPQRVMTRLGGDRLTISQLVISDGWISLSFDDRVYGDYQANFSDSQAEPTSASEFGRRIFWR